MLVFAEHQFLLSAPQSDGATLRQHLEVVAEKTGIVPDELQAHPCPEAAVYLWEWFIDVVGVRGMGASSLTHFEIEAWARMKGIELAAFEVAALRALDRVAMTQAGKNG